MESRFDIDTTEERDHLENSQRSGDKPEKHLAGKTQKASGNRWERVKGKDKIEELLSWILRF